jgi:hypothetical protein
MFAFAGLGSAAAAEAPVHEGRVMTDGHLRVGHLETIRVAGFPGKGVVQVSFFPTAICEEECGARYITAGRTDADGKGKFEVRVPGTFTNQHGRPTPYRDGERVEVEATWESADHSFDYASAREEQVIVRVHGGHRAPARVTTPSRPASREPLPIPGGFRLKASNGYTLSVSDEPPRHGTHGSLLLTATAKGRQVTYQVPATVTETSIGAHLGDLGEISVHFQRSGQATTVPCGKRTIRFDSGSWVGTIDFRGEEEFAVAEATSAPGNIEYFLDGFCGPGLFGGTSGPEKGAELFVRDPGLGPQLSVYTPRPGAAALITARLTEYSDGISIERVTNALMPSRDFSYDRRLRTAVVTPPAPFAGSAHFDLGQKAGRRWSGDLTVAMPGRPDVPLTGPLLRAELFPSG